MNLLRGITQGQIKIKWGKDWLKRKLSFRSVSLVGAAQNPWKVKGTFIHLFFFFFFFLFQLFRPPQYYHARLWEIGLSKDFVHVNGDYFNKQYPKIDDTLQS